MCYIITLIHKLQVLTVTGYNCIQPKILNNTFNLLHLIISLNTKLTGFVCVFLFPPSFCFCFFK
jgi:hypothetical protein